MLLACGPYIPWTLLSGVIMALSYALLPLTSTGSRLELSTAALFRDTHSTQSLPALADNVTEKSNGSGGNELSPTLSSEVQRDDVMNAALPRVSCYMGEARTALTEKRIADLCAHLEQASAILQALVDAVVPCGIDEAQLVANPVVATTLDENPPGDTPTMETTVEEAPQMERPRAMAAAA
jgi:hypothetical protein